LWRTSQEVFTGRKPARALRDVLKYDALYPNVNNVALLANNHDTDRFMSLKDADKDGAKLHIAFILATRGIPQLYYGEEILMTGGHDPDNRKNFPGGWTADARSAFTKEGRKEDEQETFEAVKRLIELRKKSAALKYGKTIDLIYNDDVYVFARQFNGQTVVVGINKSGEKEMLEFEEKNLGLAQGNYLLSPDGIGKNVEAISLSSNVSGKFSLIVPAKSAVFYTVLTREQYEKNFGRRTDD
jgi:glycosidase